MENSLKIIFQGLIETVPGMNLDLLKMDRFDKIKRHWFEGTFARYKVDMKKDALFRGEFEVRTPSVLVIIIISIVLLFIIIFITSCIIR